MSEVIALLGVLVGFCGFVAAVVLGFALDSARQRNDALRAALLKMARARRGMAL